MSDESRGTAPSPAAVWFRHQVEAVQADLIATVRTHTARVGSQVIAHAVVEFSGSVLAAIAEADPASQADLDAKLADLRLFVATANANRAPQ
jgi:hypothetical protein